MNEFFIAYQLSHIEEAEQKAKQGIQIICLDFWVARELEKHGVPFVSLRDLHLPSDEAVWWALAQRIAREWYQLPEMDFFTYKNIRIAEAPEPIFAEYLNRLFYYARIYEALKKQYPNGHFTFATPIANPASATECFGFLMSRAAIEAARLTKLPGTEVPPPSLRFSFPRRTYKTFLLALYNVCMGLFPRKRFRVYASEYWGHIAPLVPHFGEDAELMIMESRNIFAIPWRTRLTYRMKVLRTHDVVSKKEQFLASKKGEEYVDSWSHARGAVHTYVNSLRSDLDWSPVLEACEHLIQYAPRVVADIRTLERIMEKEKPNIVLQMASTGGPQHYFFLMARVARMHHIPTVELQHAGVTLDPLLVYSRIETDYLLTYGENVNTWHARFDRDKKLIAVGSPRFDEYVVDREKGSQEGKRLYRTLGLDPSRPVLLAAVLFSDPLLSAVDIDSYELADYFQTVRKIQEQVPGLQVLFKFRDYKYVGSKREYLNSLFPKDMAIAGSENIFHLLAASDGVLCGNSTVIYQTLILGKPLVMHPWKYFDQFRREMYAPAASLCPNRDDAVQEMARIFKDSDYRRELLERQKEFLKGYSFDGQSAKRVATLLRTLAAGVL